MERLRADPDLFPSEDYKEYFWSAMARLAEALGEVRTEHETWSHDNTSSFQFQPIDLNSLDDNPIKYCGSCDRICLLELHNIPLPPETVKKRRLSLLNGLDLGIGYIYIDFDWFNKYTREDTTFPGQDNNMYRIPRVNESSFETLQDT